MTELQRRFVEFYVQTGNATRAAILAGYSEKNSGQIGSENLKKLEIKTAIDARLKDFDSACKADTEEILKFTSRVMRGEVSEVIVTPTGKRFEAPASIKDRLKAAEMLAKIHSMYAADKVDVKIDVSKLFVESLEKVWDEQN